MSHDDPFAPPIHVESLDDCAFYHTTELPEIGLIEGHWDLRADIDDYLGRVDFSGKRVLDVGTASGFLAFHMERCGADVIAYDLSPDLPWDLVPFAKNEEGVSEEDRRLRIGRINNSFWLSHRLHGSKARLAHGTVYDVPESLAPVDVTVFGSILLHVRDPFLALQQSLRLTRDTVVIAEPDRPVLFDRMLRRLGVPPGFVDTLSRPGPRFMPRHDDPKQNDCWWYLSPRLITEYLAVLGFEDVAIRHHRALYKGRPNRLYTAVARRTHGKAIGT